ncbi:MAG: chorismate mutase [bacterium]|nr:chorismate mutase [bacterium]
MTELEKCRVEIDEIDRKIIELYEKRMNIVKKVTQYKIENSMPVLDSNRESKMLEKNLNLINELEFKKYYPSVLNGFLKASKDMQSELIDKNFKNVK